MKHLLITAGFFILTGIFQLQAQETRALSFNPVLKPFYHGVASGDPTPNKVIIWTRVTPDSGFVGMAMVDWRMALDTGMTQIVQSGTFVTDATKDYTVKVDVGGLNPNTYYYYEFTYDSLNSIRGRTRTTPSQAQMQDSLRFGVVSCSNYEAGFFNVYRILNERNDIDAVIHLGDYIYEYEHNGYSYNATAGRVWEPANEIITLYDYRTRYNCYKLDNDLMRLHQNFPFIMVWDDHESANDSYTDGAENHNTGEGSWVDRKSASQRAYMEWNPIRPQAPNDNSLIYRKLNFGPLMDLIMLDTRLIGREVQSGTTGSTVTNPNRTILGTTQYNWLCTQLLNTQTKWKILGQQVMFAPLTAFGLAVNGDQWDGYPAERNKIMSFVMANDVKNVAVLTGDIHTAWANDVPTANYNSNGNGSAFVEFVTTSVTSPGSPLGGLGVGTIKLANPHIKYINLDKKGFLILDVNQNKIQSDYFFLNSINTSNNNYYYEDSYYSNAGERFLRHTSTVAFPRPGLTDIVHAPLWPRPVPVIEDTSGTVDPPVSVQEVEEPVVVGVYPNPFSEGFSIQIYLPQNGPVQFEIRNLAGQLVSQTKNTYQSGLQFIPVQTPQLANGIYLLHIQYPGGTKTVKMVKQ